MTDEIEPAWKTTKYLPLSNDGNEHLVMARINALIARRANMTPGEELHAKLYNGYKVKVKDMSDLDMRAFREELAKIAFEAKAGIGAVDDEERERKKARKKADGPSGFERNVNVDETTSDAINNIKKRAAKLSKQEKWKKTLMEDMFMSEEDADRAISARNIKDRIGGHSDGGPKADLIASVLETAPEKKIFNPFAKKTETETTTE